MHRFESLKLASAIYHLRQFMVFWIENMNTLILPVIQFHYEGLLSPMQLSDQLHCVSEYIMRP